MSALFRKWALLTFLIALLASLAGPVVLLAQFRVDIQPERAEVEEGLNLYLSLEGSAAAKGFFLSVPEDWVLQQVVRFGENGLISNAVSGLDVRPPHEDEPRTLVRAHGMFLPGERVLLRLVTSSLSGTARIVTTPIYVEGGLVAPDESLSSEIQVNLTDKVDRSSNHVAKFDGGQASGQILSLSDLPIISPDLAYSSSFWIKTTGLNEVVLSTWSGIKDDDYAFEVVIDPAGFLEFYHGRDQQHYSMRSQAPVADGNWHFTAISNSPENGSVHLMIDGTRADSLYHPMVLPTLPAGWLGVGRRPLSDLQVADLDHFSGQLDELRMLPRSVSFEQTQSERRRPSPVFAEKGLILTFEDDSYVSGGIVLAFETGLTPFDNNRFDSREQGFRLAASDLLFRRAPGDLRVQVESAGVRLTFSSDDTDVREFVVERSSDGERFEEVIRLPAARVTGVNVYEHMDFLITGGAISYRVTPVYPDGMGPSSRALKAGLGEDNQNLSAALDGNFPNPFNPTTTISFTVEETQHIRISVWDLSGQMIATLVDATRSPGQFDVSFNANTLPSGTYFVRMESDSGIQTRPMMLMK